MTPYKVEQRTQYSGIFGSKFEVHSLWVEPLLLATYMMSRSPCSVSAILGQTSYARRTSRRSYILNYTPSRSHMSGNSTPSNHYRCCNPSAASFHEAPRKTCRSCTLSCSHECTPQSSPQPADPRSTLLAGIRSIPRTSPHPQTTAGRHSHAGSHASPV